MHFIIPPALGIILMISAVLRGNAQHVDVVIDFTPTGSIQFMDSPTSGNPGFRSVSKNFAYIWFGITLPAFVNAGITITSERHAEPFPVFCFSNDGNNQISKPQHVTYGTTFFPGNNVPGKTYTATNIRHKSSIWIGLPAGILLEITIAYL